ncbi:FKBP-type peptidyl-prolyl cis-trans isomerase 2 [Deinobacterium chartae]|uniref:Peptidyl-prolyl cis-trans isomerase n=1 Tax=Deinobacterium chartae TaxID=521158 RepID=A0A841I2C9_9DEIO|nr:FKBP-type peptidyl-prolyl cis-trans isomerase [Deinobacterium chartae]MBB6098498.1 FKBP-type peptidyl-prolyl cis-trans isomerase 2 [Deinobacterium chartae]
MNHAHAVIGPSSTVVLEYVLRRAGQIVDRTPEGQPLTLRVEDSLSLPGLKDALIGRRAGESFVVQVDPALGFAASEGERPQHSASQGGGRGERDSATDPRANTTLEVEGRPVSVDAEQTVPEEALEYTVTVHEVR